MAESKEDGAAFKAYFRNAHAERLRREHGLVVERVTFDPPAAQDENSALTYRDPSGRPLAPVLPPPPIDGPDVTFKAAQESAGRSLGAAAIADRRGRPWVLGNQGRLHMLLAGHPLTTTAHTYASTSSNIL